jgi:hypothetical protein
MHPGLPYKPTPDEIKKYSLAAAPEPEAPPLPVEAVPVMTVVGLSPRQHLEAAIADLQTQLEATRAQIPVLEGQLNDLRDSQGRMERDLSALVTAHEAVSGGAVQHLLPLEAAPAPPQQTAPARHENRSSSRQSRAQGGG